MRKVVLYGVTAFVIYWIVFHPQSASTVANAIVSGLGTIANGFINFFDGMAK